MLNTPCEAVGKCRLRMRLSWFVSGSELSSYWSEMQHQPWTCQSLLSRRATTTVCWRSLGCPSLDLIHGTSCNVLFSQKRCAFLENKNKHKGPLGIIRMNSIGKCATPKSICRRHVPREHTFPKSPVSSHHWMSWIDHPFLGNTPLCTALQNHVLFWARHQLWRVLWKKKNESHEAQK